MFHEGSRAIASRLLSRSTFLGRSTAEMQLFKAKTEFTWWIEVLCASVELLFLSFLCTLLRWCFSPHMSSYASSCSIFRWISISFELVLKEINYCIVLYCIVLYCKAIFNFYSLPASPMIRIRETWSFQEDLSYWTAYSRTQLRLWVRHARQGPSSL